MDNSSLSPAAELHHTLYPRERGKVVLLASVSNDVTGSQRCCKRLRGWGGKVWLVGKAAFFLNYLLSQQRGTPESWDLRRVDF